MALSAPLDQVDQQRVIGRKVWTGHRELSLRGGTRENPELLKGPLARPGEPSFQRLGARAGPNPGMPARGQPEEQEDEEGTHLSAQSREGAS